MGVSITYVTAEPVPSAVKAAVLKQTKAIVRGHLWWCESLNFFDFKGREKHLSGDTKLFLGGYSGPDGRMVDVEMADDAFMTIRDVRFIFKHLAEWSRVHGLTWVLDVEGGEVGRIADGKVSPELERFVDGLWAIAAFDSDDPEAMLAGMEDEMAASAAGEDDASKAAAIDGKYADR